MKCTRCGKCCQMFNKDLWKGGDAIAKGETCEKFAFIGGMATCTIHDRKPLICREGMGGRDVCPARKGK